jgi:hypothetical protein
VDNAVHEEEGIVWKATPEILDWFEGLRKFRLPDDFRDFACTFGPGKLGTGGWCFYVPGIDWESEPVGDGTDLALFTTGYGDGDYGVYVGLDAEGKPTRYVMDFAIVHLGWP